MARLGVPPGNPFVGGSAGAGHLVYYYLLHFSAAELAVVFHVKGWAATVAMTFVAAFASLSLMMGLAVRLAGRRAAALWVVPLALAGSLRTVLHMIWPAEKLDAVLIPGTGFAGWLFQSAWVPQHIMSASCVVAAVMLMGRLGERGFLRVIVSALLAAAGFESSAWVGGVTFAMAAPIIGAMLLLRAAPEQRVRLALHFLGAAALTILIASPVLHDQLAATSSRETGAPVAVHVHAVLGDFFAAPWRRLLDVPAYWLVLLPFALPAIAITGWVALAKALARRRIDLAVRSDALVLALLGVIGLAISGLLTSTLGDNNDLGWRAALPGIFMLTAFAATGISDWVAARARLAVAAALVATALGLPRSVEIIRANMTGVARPGAAAFAQAPAMWEAVRHHAAPDERVLNNPRFLEDFTPWPGNISWALLANRRSCYAGRVFALIFTAMSSAQREELDAKFTRVFDGKSTTDDLRELATVYGCRVVVLTPADGAWGSDPFAASPDYRLVESVADRWRIYRAVDQAK
jgi:MFS family permease